MEGLSGFFSLTFTEIICLAGLVFILFSPIEIVRGTRLVARWLRKIWNSDLMVSVRQVSRDLRGLPNRLIREAGLDEDVSQLEELRRNFQAADVKVATPPGASNAAAERKTPADPDRSEWTFPPGQEQEE